MSYRLHCGDAIGYLRQIPDASVDLAVTDIAYESLEKHRASGTTTRLKNSKSSSNEWFQVFPNARLPELFDQLYRVLKKNTHCYFFCDAETMFIAKSIGEDAGFKFWKPIVWDKQKIGMGYHYRARCEFILFFEKGKRKLNDLGVPDVLGFDRIKRPEAYPTEKPVDLLKVLIEQSSSPGEIVLDPFMGSGTAGVAALQSGRFFVGNDLSTHAFKIAEERLKNEVSNAAV